VSRELYTPLQSIWALLLCGLFDFVSCLLIGVKKALNGNMKSGKRVG